MLKVGKKDQNKNQKTENKENQGQTTSNKVRAQKYRKEQSIWCMNRMNKWWML